jgi:hypothetical protein
MRLLTAFALVVCSAAHAQLFVDEASTRARLVDGKTSVSLAIDNQSGRAVAVRINLEWVDPSDSVRSAWQLVQTVPGGKSTANAALPLKEGDAALFYRLRYSVWPDVANLAAFQPVSGILSFPMIAEHAFTLRAIGIGGPPRAGASYEFRVFASHPVTGQPIAGVRVSLDKVSALTDSNGAAVLRIAPGEDDWSGSDNVTIDGRLGDLTGETEAFRPAVARSAIRIDTDKPLYQPGQTAHIRILVLGGDGRAQADAKYNIRVFDGGSALVQSWDVTTSRFGIAGADWEIPANAGPAKYQVHVKGEEEGEDAWGQVEVRRYELPSFRVSAAPLRPFYRLGETPEVEVRGEYLFGKPVAGGKVKITEGDDDEALRDGVLDASGHFRASLQIDLDKDDFEYQRFRDFHYIAYVTDPTTNRTEQRRFDVRISRDPLHVYVVRQEETALGVRLYVAAYTPDGKPAAAMIEVLDGDRVLASGRTNRFGLTRMDIPPVKHDLVVRARVAAGTATQEVPMYPESRLQVRLDTDRALYRAGEPIRCHIRAARDGVRGMLLAWTEDGRVLYWHAVDLHNREGEAVIPYSPDFPRSLEVAFISPGGVFHESLRKVLYPGAEELRIVAKPVHTVCRPGEQAALSFQALTGKGAAVEAALGIAVVDQSVFERAETDQSVRRRWYHSGESGARIGGLSAEDLLELPPEKIDADYQLVAEALLEAGSMRPTDETFLQGQSSAFTKAAEKRLADVKARLAEEYRRTLRYPTDDDSLREIASYTLGNARDPWDQPYRDRFSIDGASAVLELWSAGPDKVFGTEDDMPAMTWRWEWFLPFQAAIRDVLAKLKDYPATPAEFADLLDQAGIRFDRLRDPAGNPLRAMVRDTAAQRTIQILTRDDDLVASYQGTYFRAAREKINAALPEGRPFPTDEAQFRTAMAAAGIDFGALRDPWGHPYTVTIHTDSDFGDRYQIYIYQEYQGAPVQRKNLVPTKVTYRTIEIHSGGEGKNGGFTVARFSRFIEEDNPPSNSPESKRLPAPIPGGSGTITGTVTDAAGAAISGAEVTLNGTYKTRTGKDGLYSLHGLPANAYEIRFFARGFQVWVVGNVPVQRGYVTRVDAKLQIGSVSQTVTVAAEAPVLNTDAAQASSVQERPAIGPNYTPHVRDYFPETLLWTPELITDSSGKASLNFKLADNITTWRVAVIGSTVDGRIAEGSAEIQAFQPFFVDLDPPQVLTVSDEISLPVPIRNYTGQEQTVSVQVNSPPELAIAQAPGAPMRIAASGSINSVVGLRAAAATAEAKLRVTARGGTAIDAIEKPVAIHPNGEPVSRSVNDIVSEGRTLRLDIPVDAIAGSLRAEVKLYPRLLTSVIESIEALLRKPTGCAEQTISASYLNLMALRALGDSGLHDGRLEVRARRNLSSGYQRLLGYRTSEGAFSYWSNQKADLAITAYAIGFLEDVHGILEIDDGVLDKARAWLSQQNPQDVAVRGLALRALVNGGAKYEGAVVQRLGELARTAESMDDPYAIATFALAAMEAKKPDLAAGAIDRLRKLVHEEQGLAWWHLVRNTPFYGWGRAGQIEATALAVTALARWRKQSGGDPQLDALIDRGALFLLRSKDDTGTWLSTQATIRVFTALFAALKPMTDVKSVDVLVNGDPAYRNVPIAGVAPIALDVAKFLKPGAANEVSVRAASGIQARFTASWYQPWNGPRTSDQLALQVRYSTAETLANEPVRCDVMVSRPSFRGYGMMIAEIGLPPGAEVDRGTLDDAEVDSYEVAPDHVTFYVWPNANDSKFSFTFRPRYGERALTAPSTLYDYYNPDARVVLPPVTMVVK